MARHDFAIVELNDSEIRVARDEGVVLRSPGYAIVGEHGIEVGEPALRRAWVNPRATQNRYWQQLSLDPLQVPTAHARHHADLAYAHLLALHERAGKPAEMVFAVPGHYSNEQLALLLGLVEASPFTAIGLVDAAVAAAAAQPGTGVRTHAELYLHHTVVTRVDTGEEVSRTAVDVVEGAGWAAVLDECAAVIADRFIEQSRFDPQHHAETEQALYDQIPEALQALAAGDEAGIEIPWQNATYVAKLPRAAVLDVLQPLYRRILAALSAGGATLLGDRLAGLPGFAALREGAERLAADALFRTCRAQIQRIRSTGPALDFVIRLPAVAAPEAAGTSQPGRAPVAAAEAPPPELPVTHLLCGHRAWPLGDGPLHLDGRSGRPRPDAAGAQVSLQAEAGRVVVEPLDGATVRLNGREITGSARAGLGDHLRVGGAEAECLFIHVPR